jgi:hypothetical protein
MSFGRSAVTGCAVVLASSVIERRCGMHDARRFVVGTRRRCARYRCRSGFRRTFHRCERHLRIVSRSSPQVERRFVH